MNGALLLGLGAICSGMASLISALAGLRAGKRQAEDECDKRVSEWERAFKEGMGAKPRRKDDEMGERWSHLP